MCPWLRLQGCGSWSRLSCSKRQAWAKPSLKFQRVPSPGGAESVSLVVSGDSWGNAAVRTKEGVDETPWRRQAPRPPCGTLAVSCPRQGPCRPAPPGKQLFAGPRRSLETLMGKLCTGHLILKASGFRALYRSTWAEPGPSTSQKLSPRRQPLLSHPPQIQASAETDLRGPLKG